MTKIIQMVLMSVLILFAYGCSRNEGQLGADAQADAVPEILGTYVLNGTDHLGNDYGGHLTILAGTKPGEYKLQWIINESIQQGTGYLEGNQLIIQWQSIDPSIESYHGSVIYTVTINGELYGKRTVDGREGSGTETAYPNR